MVMKKMLSTLVLTTISACAHVGPNPQHCGDFGSSKACIEQVELGGEWYFLKYVKSYGSPLECTATTEPIKHCGMAIDFIDIGCDDKVDISRYSHENSDALRVMNRRDHESHFKEIVDPMYKKIKDRVWIEEGYSWGKKESK